MASAPRRSGAATAASLDGSGVPPNYWDPIAYQHEQPTPYCLLRPLPGVFVALEESDVTKIHAVLVGPAKTPYQGGFFYILLKCPPDYPISPPRVRFMTTDQGRVTFHPYIYSTGKVCLSLLGTYDGSAWSPAHTLGTVLLSMQSIMSEDPFEESSAARSVSLIASVRGQRTASTSLTVLHETIRVAVPVRKTFGENKAFYEGVCENNIAADCDEMCGDGIISAHGSKYEFLTLLTRLRALGEQAKREENGAAPAGATEDTANSAENATDVNSAANSQRWTAVNGCKSHN
ncbi:hypothetical protein HPB50_008730 [Hyalomma asiaticum]|uniref:Uncharacterized protein n=1 Tax=Hyalomma asiaticum TaxID=266040 RepID=A0ACB7SDJ2_HYAAI|nr:hypothetical protein HPB50_008730 [Hyalomma asiaticum]